MIQTMTMITTHPKEIESFKKAISNLIGNKDKNDIYIHNNGTKQFVVETEMYNLNVSCISDGSIEVGIFNVGNLYYSKEKEYLAFTGHFWNLFLRGERIPGYTPNSNHWFEKSLVHTQEPNTFGFYVSDTWPYPAYAKVTTKPLETGLKGPDGQTMIFEDEKTAKDAQSVMKTIIEVLYAKSLKKQEL